MNWTDLAALSFLFWGAAGGYILSRQNLIIKFVFFYLSLLTACLFSKQLVLFLNLRYSVTAYMTHVFYQVLHVPVGLADSGKSNSLVLSQLDLPKSIQDGILLLCHTETASLPAGGVTLAVADRLAELVVQLSSFLITFVIVWGCFFVVAGLLGLERKGRGRLCLPPVGTILGGLRSIVMVIIFSGLIYPLSLLTGDSVFKNGLYSSLALDWAFRIFSKVMVWSGKIL